MSSKKTERNLAGMVSEELYETFTEQSENAGVKVKRALAAAAKLWIELPAEIRSKLLDQTIDANSLVLLVQEIVDETIAEGQKAARKARRKKKRL